MAAMTSFHAEKR